MPGTNTGVGKDYTIFSKINGTVEFSFVKKQTRN